MSRTAVGAADVDVVVLSVHGPRGIVDLTVSSASTVEEVARAYAEQAHPGLLLPLATRTGRMLAPGTTIAAAGVASGAVLIAVGAAGAGAGAPVGGRAGSRARRTTGTEMSEPLPWRAGTLWLAVAVACAAIGALCGLALPEDERLPVVLVLGAAAVLGVLPGGSAGGAALAGARALAAPAFGAAACIVEVWDAEPARLPSVIGAAALAAAVVAGFARVLADPDDGVDEALRVWVVAGAGVFATAALAVFVDVAPQVVWALLLIVAVLASRAIPMVAVDVPDHYLLDLERLAVNAWSARGRPPGKRGRVVIAPDTVGAVAAAGTRMLTAAALAVLAITVVSAPLLLEAAGGPVDRVGARVLVGAGGATLVLAARSYRHTAARTALRIAGLWCLLLVVIVLLRAVAANDDGIVLAVVAIAAAFGLIALAVLVGRGWRSAWWSRRAEVAETLCGSVAVGSVVVAVGLFRQLWELTG